MKRYICSDLHLGHSNIHRFRSQFKTAEDHHELVFNNLQELQGKRSMLFLLGDVAFTDEWVDKITDLRFGRKVLLLGNHDTDRKININKLFGWFDEVHSLLSYKGTWLSHCPIHPIEIRKKHMNIHGHTHPYLMLDNSREVDNKYRNVCMEYTNYKPIDFEFVVSDDYVEHCKEIYNNLMDEK